MTMAAANLEIREALAAHEHEARSEPPGRNHALWQLELALEQLHLKGRTTLAAGFRWPTELTADDVVRLEGLRPAIRDLIAVIFDELLPQPRKMPDDDRPYHPYRGLNGRWLIAVRPWTSKAETERLLRVVLGAFESADEDAGEKGAEDFPPTQRLTRSERAIFEVLSQNRGQVVTHAALRVLVGWDEATRGSDATLRVHITRLRAKILPQRIIIIRGIGYQLAA